MKVGGATRPLGRASKRVNGTDSKITRKKVKSPNPLVNQGVSVIRGYSSAGRASEWHSEGQRFDPAYLHQKQQTARPKTLRFRLSNRLKYNILHIVKETVLVPIIIL